MAKTLTDKITFVFEDSESGAREFVKFLIDSAILDIEVKCINNADFANQGDIAVDEFQVGVSYWIDTMGVSIAQSIAYAEEFFKEGGIEYIAVYYNEKLLREYRICTECGELMKEGYVWDNEFYCSKECLDKHYTQEEQDRDMYCLNEGEVLSNPPTADQQQRFEWQDLCYYTSWSSYLLEDE